MKTVTHRMVKGSLLLSIANALVNLLTMASTVILARFLTPADYGLVAIATTILAVMTSITTMPLGQALIRHESPGQDEIDCVWSLGFARGVLLAAIFAAAAYPVADIYGDPRLVEIMFSLALVPLVFGMENPRRFVLQRDLNFNQEFILSLSAKTISFTLTVIVAVIYKSYWALIIGNISLPIFGVAISYILMKYRPHFNFKRAREFLFFSVWVTAGQIISTLNWRFEYLLIGKWLGTAQLGFYSVGNNLAMLPTQETIKPLKQTIFPAFSRVIEDPDRIRSAYQRAQTFVTALALPVGIGVAAIADPLVRLLMTDKWLPAVMIIQSLAAIFALQTLGSLVQPLGMAKNQTKLLFVRDTQMFFLRLPIIIVGLWFWGLPGIVVARIVTGLISIAVNMLLVKKLINLPVWTQLSANARSLASSAVMVVCVLATASLIGPEPDRLHLGFTIAIQILVGAVSYVGTSFALWYALKRPNGPEDELLKIVAGALGRRGRPAAPKLT